MLARRMKAETPLEFVHEARQERSREQRLKMYSCLLPRFVWDAVNRHLALEIQEQLCIQSLGDFSYADSGQWLRSSLLSNITEIMPWLGNVVDKNRMDSICVATLETVECWP